ncbi:MAG TPA: hypothetical protein VFQ65_21200, partial [Kofleriaceae bacterium]|nr:hypothetical protein [Kofleriaceae bacterium]
ALPLSVFGVACGDDSPNVPSDSPTTPPGDGSGSGSGMPNATLTSYVIDLVINHTVATETAHAYSEFSTLPDPDGMANNGSAYASLF